MVAIIRSEHHGQVLVNIYAESPADREMLKRVAVTYKEDNYLVPEALVKDLPLRDPSVPR